MGGMGKKSDTFTRQPTIPYYVGPTTIEAAKYLMNVCRRFISERANVADVNKAIEIWQEETTSGIKDRARIETETQGGE